jgi:hypothetical protein
LVVLQVHVHAAKSKELHVIAIDTLVSRVSLQNISIILLTEICATTARRLRELEATGTTRFGLAVRSAFVDLVFKN